MSKKNVKRKTTSHQRGIPFYVASLFRSSSPGYQLSEFRKEMPPSMYQPLIERITSSGLFGQRIFSRPYPRSPQELRSTPALTPTTADREFRWAGAFLPTHAPRLARYVSLSSEFQHSFLVSDYAKCETVLDEIQSDLGYSLWLIKNRIALLQLSKGLEAQKRYTAQVKQEALERGIVPFVTHYVSFRTETSVSSTRFAQQFEHILSNPEVSDGLKAYLKYQILPGSIHSSEEEMASILRYENMGGIVDYYEALLAMSRMAVVAHAHGLSPAIVSTLQKVGNVLPDFRIGMLLFELGDKELPPIQPDANCIEAFDRFLSADYARALSMAGSLLTVDPHNFDLAETAARSMAVLQNSSTEPLPQPSVSVIICLMSSILAKSEGIEKAVSDLLKIAWNLSDQTWATSLLSFIHKEMSSDPLETAHGLVHFASLGVPRVHPLRIAGYPNNDIRSAYAKVIQDSCGHNSPSVSSYCSAFCTADADGCNLETLGYEERLLLEAELSLRRGEVESALGLAGRLLESSRNYYRHRSIRIISHSLVNLGQTRECIDFVTTAFVREPYLYQILPVDHIVAALSKEERSRLQNNISVPIVFDMHVRFNGHQYESIRNYAYEDFLLSNGISRPSELRNIMSRFDKDLLVYFLRSVCIEPVMDCSTSFERSEDLARERLEVCRLLSEIDGSNVESYQIEIRDIHRRLVIKKKLQEIERSKVYVDIDSIRKTLTQSLNESFERYISFLRDRIDQIDLTLRQLARETAARGDAEGLLALALPQNEMNDLFQSIILELRDQFVSSTEDGLDAYLSVRIRHGTFSGQLRSPLEAANLITARDNITGEYKRNQHWIDRLGINELELADYVAGCFRDFSRAYDQLVSEMVTEWIQVNKTIGDKGLFNFMLLKPEIALLAGGVTAETTLEAFLNLVFNYFFERLDGSLKIIRDRIGTEAKPRASEILTSLQTSIDRLRQHGVETGELLAAIGKARTEVQLAFDRVIEWFRLSKTARREPFTIEDAVEVSVNSLKTNYPDFQADVSICNTMENMMIEGSLPSFVDILYIIFENIARHSRIPEPKAYARVDNPKDLIVIRVENDVADGVATQEANARIQKIKTAMEGHQYRKSVITEGGTGFHKIRKILSHDIKSSRTTTEAKLDFGFAENRRFFVEVAMPIIGYREANIE